MEPIEQAKLRLQVLLAEYAAMRAQVIARGSSIMQIAAVGVASLTLAATALSWILKKPDGTAADGTIYLFVFLFAFLLGLTLVMVLFNHRDVVREARQVEQLERLVNQQAGMELLTWETKFGGAKVGFWIDFWPKPWPLVRSAPIVFSALALAVLSWLYQLYLWLRFGEASPFWVQTNVSSFLSSLHSDTWRGWSRVIDFFASCNLGIQVILGGLILAGILASVRFVSRKLGRH